MVLSSSSVTNTSDLTTTIVTDPQHPLAINMLNVTKLSSNNYLTWSIQIKSLLRGYDLIKYIDGYVDPPQPTIVSNGKEESNQAFIPWQRQDSLLYSALIGAIETPLQPLIASSTSSLKAWNTLASTYGKPTRGHIKQLKQQLRRCVKGTKTIDEFMQLIKTKSYALALLGNPVDSEDIIDIVLKGLSDDYRQVIESIHSRDVPISFAELHEKLINRETALLSAQPPSSFPVTANVAQNRNKNWRPVHPNYLQQNNSQRNNQGHRQSRPYLGKCQACGTQGHNAKYCPQFRLVSHTSQPDAPFQPRGASNWTPRAYNAPLQAPDSSSWLLDTGASHHITSDLATSLCTLLITVMRKSWLVMALA